ncbi:hypothetical protein [Sporosarcina limicola]|uniref:Uncharacterized protein n=1 Tax=Sporosarcina limicola TaxID=34101 RepID=A0A927R2S8_9BACL|nr:hypothetical protein [Sporosarcina limicola]MBE1554266.1 hypothetical protein [Sporosarcina limicola]
MAHVIDFRSADALYQSFEELWGVIKSTIEIYRHENNNECYINDFLDECGIDIEAVLEQDIWLKGLHVTTSCTDCQTIREMGLLNLTESVTQETELKQFLQAHGIEIHLATKTVRCGDHIITLQAERGGDMEQEWIHHKLFKDFYINAFLFKENPLDYSNIRECPEFLSKLDERIKDELGIHLDLKKKWMRLSDCYILEIQFPSEQLHVENIQCFFRKYHADLSDREEQIERLKWIIKTMFYGIKYSGGSEITILLEDDYVVPPQDITIHNAQQ